MRLSKPEDDPNEAVEETSGEPTTVEIDGETVPIAEAVERVASESSPDPEAVADVQASVAFLEARVESHEAVLQELVELSELFGAWLQNDADHAKHAEEIVSTADSDAYPWEWESETLSFKSEWYE